MNIKTMTKADLLEQRAANLEERSSITDGCKGDTPLTAEQVSRLEEIRSINALIDVELDVRREEERKAKPAPTPAKRRATLVETLRALAGMGARTDEVEEVLERGRKQMEGVRGVSVSGTAIPVNFRADNTVKATTDPGKQLVGEQTALLDAKTSDLVFARAGATILTGLTDNLKFASGDLPQAVWEDEVAKIDESKLTIDTVTLAPKRLGIVVSISKQMLAQDTVGINQWLADLMEHRTYEALEQALLSGTSVAKGPKSLLDAAAYSKIKAVPAGAISYEELVKMQGVLAGNDTLRGKLGYIGTPLLRTTLKSVPLDPKQSLGFVLGANSNDVAGYPLYTTALATATKGENVLFADWVKLVIGQWGAFDVTVDPYSQADLGKVRLIINSYWDAAPIDQLAFAKASLTLEAATPASH